MFPVGIFQCFWTILRAISFTWYTGLERDRKRTRKDNNEFHHYSKPRLVQDSNQSPILLLNGAYSMWYHLHTRPSHWDKRCFSLFPGEQGLIYTLGVWRSPRYDALLLGFPFHKSIVEQTPTALMQKRTTSSVREQF